MKEKDLTKKKQKKQQWMYITQIKTNLDSTHYRNIGITTNLPYLKYVNNSPES